MTKVAKYTTFRVPGGTKGGEKGETAGMNDCRIGAKWMSNGRENTESEGRRNITSRNKYTGEIAWLHLVQVAWGVKCWLGWAAERIMP